MNLDTEIKPRLRNVDPVRVMVDGTQVIGLRDPLGLSENMVCFHPQTIPVLALFDGTHTLRDIQEELTRRAGTVVFMDDINALVSRLDEAFLLEGDRYREAYDRKVIDYRSSPYRLPAHAGTAYSGDPERLRAEMNGYFLEEGGPGLPDLFSDPRRPVGLIAPHIDIRAGGASFAKAYHALASGQPSDLYVIFGTGHAGVERMFTAGTLDYLTPLGKVETDREIVAELEAALGRDPAAEEILHATEHVIEFQIIFLRHVFAGRHNFKILPLLCSLSHHTFAGDGKYHRQRQLFQEYCRAVKDVCTASGRSVCFIASADLDHIGPRYGDGFEPHQGTIKDALEKDAQLVKTLEKVDSEGFIRHVASEDDARRICGFSPITAMLECMDATEGRLLSLDYARVDNRNSFVSFTSMIFH